MNTFFTLFLFLLIVSVTTAAFISPAPSKRVRGVTSTHSCVLYAAAPKKATKKTTKKTAKTADAETFRKPDFISSVQEKTGLSKADSEAALNAVLDTISEQVSLGKRINLQGFGTFKLSPRAARKGRNPQTGEEIQIAASNSPSFTASKTFKEKCNPER